MFDQITVILAAFTGKLKDHPTLRKFFWAFLAAIVFAVLVLAYNAFMSLNYYSGLLERFTNFGSNALAVVVTVAIALTAYFLISSITGTFLDYIGGRKDKTEGHLPMFVAVVVALVLILWLDITANLKGVDYVAHSTTAAVQANPVPVITSSHDARIKEAAARWDADIAAVNTKLDRLKKPLGNSSHRCNREGCEKGVHNGRTGLPHWDGVFTPFGLALVSKYESRIDELRAEKAKELAAIRAERTTSAAIAESEYKRDVNRYESTVSDKQQGHTHLVWFAYGLAALLSIFTNHYADKALEHIRGKSRAFAGHSAPGSWTPSANYGPAIGFKPPQAPDNSPQDITAILERLEALTAAIHSPRPDGTHGDRAYPKTPFSEAQNLDELPANYGTFTLADGSHTTGFKITCEHCGKTAIMQSPKARFCSTECRKAAYEDRTGKKLRV